MRKRRILSSVVTVLAALAVLYVGAGIIIYNRLSSVSADCARRNQAFTPSAFTTIEGMDTTPYLMPDYQDVSFTSRDDALALSGWFIPAQSVPEEQASAVIVVHGLSSCKRHPTMLLSAGMLHRNGFDVLMLDLRDHGESQIEDGRYAGGTEEYRDVLGAWDWLVSEKSIPPERIGLFGTSLGAATVLIAMGEEPRVAATWEDSGYADIYEAIEAELARNRYPTFLAPGGIFLGRLISGDDLTARSPLAAIARLDGRPLFITHGSGDTRLSPAYADNLAAAVEASGSQAEVWLVEGSEHVGAIYDHYEEYERHLAAFFRESLGG